MCPLERPRDSTLMPPVVSRRSKVAKQLRYPLHRLGAEVAALHKLDQFAVIPLRRTRRANGFADAIVHTSGWSAVGHQEHSALQFITDVRLACRTFFCKLSLKAV